MVGGLLVAIFAIGYAFGNVFEHWLAQIGTERLILLGIGIAVVAVGGWFAWRKWRERSA